MVEEINTGLSLDEWDKVGTNIGRPSAGLHEGILGAVVDYSESAYQLPFSLAGGPWAGFTGSMYGAKTPKKNDDGSIFWPVKNWATAVGIEPDKSSGTVKYTKEQLAEFEGKRCLILFKDEPYKFKNDKGEVIEGIMAKPDHLKPLPDKKVEEVAI